MGKLARGAKQARKYTKMCFRNFFATYARFLCSPIWRRRPTVLTFLFFLGKKKTHIYRKNYNLESVGSLQLFNGFPSIQKYYQDHNLVFGVHYTVFSTLKSRICKFAPGI